MNFSPWYKSIKPSAAAGSSNGLALATRLGLNTSALRAPQGYAPGQADDNEKKENEKQKGDISNEVRKRTF
jgi:hypothetical protein